jgi:hypothetical protein
MAEEDFRRLQAEAEGLDPGREVALFGTSFPLRETGDLTALLRFAMAARLAREAGEDQADYLTLAITYQLLSECIHPQHWPAFQEHAIATKASQGDIAEVVNRALEIFTARPAVAGIRLLSWAAQNLGELDGRLLSHTGAGLEARSARQVANIAFAMITDGLEEEKREEFLEDLNRADDPETSALQLALAMIEEKKRAAEANGSGHPVESGRDAAVPGDHQ